MKLTAKVWMTVAAFAAAFFGSVWVKTQLIRTGYQITELKAQLRSLELELAHAEISLARVKSPSAAAAKAKAAQMRLPFEYPLENIRYAPNRGSP